MDMKKDIFEDFDIRINRKFTSLLLSNQKEGTSYEDHTQAIPTKRLKILPTSEYLKKYKTLTVQSPTILPPGCRYIESTQKGGKIYVIEEPPQFRTVAMALSFDIMYEEIRANGLLKEYGIEGWLSTCSKNRDESYFKLNLAFPYVIFLFYLTENRNVSLGYSFLRTNQMVGLSDYLIKMPLTNISESQKICFGNRLNDTEYKTDFEAIASAIDVFWTSIFNVDYTYNIKSYSNVAGISNFLEWQYLSRKDPMFIYRVDWIKYKKNIFELINHVKGFSHGNNRGTDYETGGDIYNSFLNTFTKPAVIAEIEKGKIRKKIVRIYYDIASGYYLNALLKIEVGDSFENVKKTKKYYIISFIGMKGQNPSIIRLSLNEKLFNFKLTVKSIEYLKERIEEQRYIKTIQVNGLELKANDIIKYKDAARATIYKKVYYIRKSLDDRPEIRLGNRYFLAQNLPKGLEKIDVGDSKIYEMDLKKGEEYLYCHSYKSNHTIVMQIERCVFDGIDIGAGGQLIYRFKSLNRDTRNHLTIPINEIQHITYRKIFPKIDKSTRCNNPLVLSTGRTLRKFTTYTDAGHEVPASIYRSPTNYLCDIDTQNQKADKESMEFLVIDDKTFEVETHSGIIRFEIGDLVIVANWTNPLNILNIRRIEAFKIERKTRSTNISFILIDKAGNLTEEVYVSGNVIRIGYIRKIITKFEGLSSGTKIIATKGRISNFPKKDYNIIIGIIVDGPNPLVLCSNGCTLWYQDVMENFKQIPITSIKWKNADHADLEPKKIKPQSGDITTVSYNSSPGETGFLMMQLDQSRALRYHQLSAYHRSYDSYSASSDKLFQEECIFNCIPNPRISKSQQDKIGYVRATPNFHGGFILNDKSKFLYVNDPRSFINV
jgi:hypothetical protein